jgi:hypothetical protein
MSIDYLTSRWTEYARWFFGRSWERSELILLALIVASLALVIVKSRQNIRRARKSQPSESAQHFRGL